MIEILLQIDSNDPDLSATLSQMFGEGWNLHDQKSFDYEGHEKKDLHFWFRKELTTKND